MGGSGPRLLYERDVRMSLKDLSFLRMDEISPSGPVAAGT